MTFLNVLRTALSGIAANKLRTGLTMLGIIIGVASVIATLALGNGARAAVENSFRFLGSDQIQVSGQFAVEDGEPRPAGKLLSYEDGLTLTDAAPLIDRVEMAVSGTGKVRHGQVTLDMPFTGVDAGALTSKLAGSEVQPVGWPAGDMLTAAAFLARGRFFTHSEVAAGAQVCVLGYETADDLFLGDDPIGQTVWINRKPCAVIGVIAELETVDQQERTRSKPNEAFYLPVSTAVQTLFENAPWVEITAHVTDEARMEEAKTQIAAHLRMRHGIEQREDGKWLDDFRLTTKKDILGVQQDAARTFAVLLTALAVVSLVVGGFGIMNVMLVSVTERTREIGVRMAVGAQPQDIVLQFLLEAALLSLAGGLLGILAGILTIPLAASLNAGLALLDPASIPVALAVALATGIIFGLYPALRAARLDPIEALRYE